MSGSHTHNETSNGVNGSTTSAHGHHSKPSGLFGFIELNEHFGGDERLVKLAEKLANDPNYRDVKIYYCGPATNKRDPKYDSINKYCIKFMKGEDQVAEGRAFDMKDATMGCRSALEKKYGNVVNDWFSNLQ